MLWFLLSSDGCLPLKRYRIGSHSVHKAGCFASSSLVLMAWRILGEPLVFSLLWKPEESGSNMRAELASESEGSRHRVKVPFFPVLFMWLPPEGVAQV